MLGFLRHIRFDIIYALNQLSRFSQNPTYLNHQFLGHVIGYLRKYPSLHLKFYPNNNNDKLVAVVDAALANDEGFHSTSGYFIYFGNTLIDWNSTTQKRIATSSAEAELNEFTDLQRNY